MARARSSAPCNCRVRAHDRRLGDAILGQLLRCHSLMAALEVAETGREGEGIPGSRLGVLGEGRPQKCIELWRNRCELGNRWRRLVQVCPADANGIAFVVEGAPASEDLENDERSRV